MSCAFRKHARHASSLASTATVCGVTNLAAFRSTISKRASVDSIELRVTKRPSCRRTSAQNSRFNRIDETGARGRRSQEHGKASLKQAGCSCCVKHQLVTRRFKSPAFSSAAAMTTTSIGNTGAVKTIPALSPFCIGEWRELMR